MILMSPLHAQVYASNCYRIYWQAQQSIEAARHETADANGLEVDIVVTH